MAAVKPGVRGGELTEIVAEVLRGEGIQPTIEVVGHGVGLNPHEPPMLAEDEEAPIEEGMVLAVEVWVVDWSGISVKEGKLVPEVYGNEDLVVVTKNGCDRFPYFRKDIRSLPYEGSLV